jgi:Aldo/keto reductase family
MNGKPTAAAAGKIDVGGDLTVNRLGFGAMRITGPGIWGDPPDRDRAKEALRRAVALDVNFIDTADPYGPEASERLIAETLYPYPEALVIATKGGLVRPGPARGSGSPTLVLHDPDPMRIVRREGGTITPDGGPLTTAAYHRARQWRQQWLALFEPALPEPAIPAVIGPDGVVHAGPDGLRCLAGIVGPDALSWRAAPAGWPSPATSRSARPRPPG